MRAKGGSRVSVCSRPDARGGPAAHAGLEDDEDGSVFAARPGGRLLGAGDAGASHCRAVVSPRRVCAGADSAVQRRRLRGAAAAESVRPAGQVCAGRDQRHAGGRGDAAARPGPAVHRVVPPETGGPSCAGRGGQGAARHHAGPHPARPGVLVPTHEDLEGEPRPRLCRQKNASVRSTRPRRRTPA